jgi:hypothetical protein
VNPDVTEFAALIDTLANGDTANEATHKLHELIKACRQTFKTGTLTLTITIAPKFGDGPDLEITDKLAVKTPQPDRSSTYTWVDKEGRISLTDPNQDALPNITDISVRGDRR